MDRRERLVVSGIVDPAAASPLMLLQRACMGCGCAAAGGGGGGIAGLSGEGGNTAAFGDEVAGTRRYASACGRWSCLGGLPGVIEMGSGLLGSILGPSLASGSRSQVSLVKHFTTKLN